MSLGKLIPHVSLPPNTYATTLDISFAMVNGYIGEIHTHPTELAVAMRRLFHRPAPPFFVFYYYGTPDDRLRTLFGYPDSFEGHVCTP